MSFELQKSQCLVQSISRILVVLATKNVESAPFVVKSIEEHLPKMKLPLLYLVDSLVKEIGDPYKSLFATNIGHSFSIVYQKVRGSKKSSMLELRQSWSSLFPSTDLYALDVLVKSIDPEWPITAPKPAAVSSKTNKEMMTNRKKFPNPRKELLFRFLFRIKLPLFRPMACSVQKTVASY